MKFKHIQYFSKQRQRYVNRKNKQMVETRNQFKYRASGFYIIAAVCLRKPSQVRDKACKEVKVES